MNVSFQILSPNVSLPAYAHDGDAGLDLQASHDVFLPPGVVVEVNTGIAVSIPRGYEGQVRGRSGMLFRRCIAAPQTGTIDAGYRGEIKVALVNLGPLPQKILKGDRCAQFVIAPVARVVPVRVDVLEGGTARGVGGFGSTGV